MTRRRGSEGYFICFMQPLKTRHYAGTASYKCQSLTFAGPKEYWKSGCYEITETLQEDFFCIGKERARSDLPSRKQTFFHNGKGWKQKKSLFGNNVFVIAHKSHDMTLCYRVICPYSVLVRYNTGRLIFIPFQSGLI